MEALSDDESVEPTRPNVHDTEHYFLRVPASDKAKSTWAILDKITPPMTVIFTNPGPVIESLKCALKEYGFQVSAISDDMGQLSRDEEIKKFDSRRTGILIMSDTNSAGIDMQKVPFVINYDMPANKDVYIRRTCPLHPDKRQVVNIVSDRDDLSMVSLFQALFDFSIPEIFPPFHELL